MNPKRLILLIFLLGLSSAAFADCKTTIDPTDKIGDVKKNMDCLANQVAQLKDDLAKQQAALTAATSKSPHMALQLPNPAFHNLQECHDWATQYLNANHFMDIQDTPPIGIGGTNLSSKAAFVCLPSSQVLFVVAGSDPSAVHQWAQVFMDAIKATFHLP